VRHSQLSGGTDQTGSRAQRAPLEGRRITVEGIVQGVGFRPFVHRLATANRITGRVRNHSAGATIDIFGERDALERFCRQLVLDQPPAAKLTAVGWSPIGLESCASFEIDTSEGAGARRVSIPADIATCAECLEELSDPRDRRYRYPFINCTNCGPRFTIALDLPYDRCATTMARFEMCPECRREYEHPRDRRFHAQPIACPACGPRLWLADPSGDRIQARDPIEVAAGALRAGSIVAVKGLGGFHLACDATSRDAVALLRRRKRRDQRPFAVMVRDPADAGRMAELTDAERALLASPERPIVLVRRAARAQLAPEVAPDSPLVGLMLAYTPLHHLLLEAAGRPLVMTSGNVTEEPIAYRNRETLERLGKIADLFVLHDREIAAPCDDSVARVIDSAPMIIRRSRGYVPRPVPIAQPFEEPILAVGGQLKNAFCLGVGDAAWFGPHVGDLDNLETFEAFEAAVARMERFVGAAPQVVAHDLHPDYQSTRYARARAFRLRVPVQHHHAHLASAMAENGIAGPALGVAFDGAGLGSDGTMWGGELLLGDFSGFERIGTLRPIALAGGDRAVREVWRLALALVDDAFDGRFDALDRIALFDSVDLGAIPVVRRMIASGLNTISAHGAGRYFDAVGALVFARRRAAYEGQVAVMLDNFADSQETGAYEFAVDRGERPWRLDLRPMVRRIVQEVIAGVPGGRIAARFHNTLIEGAAAMVRALLGERGRVPVVLSGGCFQNPRLAQGIAAALRDVTTVHLNRTVPPGDGGIALGQAMVASAFVDTKQSSQLNEQAPPATG
jgi:hydrogenase maturation protein HypF